MKIPDWARAGLMTGVFVFVSGVAATLVGWLNDVASWADASGGTPFPDPSVLRGALASAAAAALTGALNAAVRAVQARFTIGSPPLYP